MLLQKLSEYGFRIEKDAAEENESIPSEYTKQTITWIIDLDTSGQFRGFVRTSSGESKKDRGKKFAAPYLRRSGSKVKPQLLADKAEFVLGISADDPPRAQSRHRDFVALVKACAKETSEETVQAVVKFLEQMAQDLLPSPVQVAPSDFMTFRVGDVFPIALSSVQEFWKKVAPVLGAKGIDELTSDRIRSWLLKTVPTDGQQNWECIVCGMLCQPARVHPIAIKLPRSVADQQCSIVTGNKDAFLSYGLEQSFIAPTCRPCSERYAKVVNHLVQREDTHITVGPLVYVFWAKEERGFSIASLLSKPEPEEVRALIDSAFSGKRIATGIDTTPFYATAFSASGGRVAVRDWIDTTIENAQHSLARYFSLQRLVERDGSEGKPYGMYALAASILPPKSNVGRDLAPQIPKALIHMAIKGGSLPMWLLFQAVKRNRADGGITRNRAALIKMVLLSQQSDFTQEEVMASLDIGNRNAAYLCGRLLAVLEAIQYRAVRPKATLVDRFYGTASSAPASVFGHLLRGGQNHLAKLRKEHPGAHTNLQKRLEEILDGMEAADGYPHVLTLHQQGIFGLGYYHQRAADRAAAIAHKQSSEKGNIDLSNDKTK